VFEARNIVGERRRYSLSSVIQDDDEQGNRAPEFVRLSAP
jgi:hypothetical protein